MRAMYFLVVPILSACGVAPVEGDTDTDGAVTCEPLTEGTWIGTGTCFGMTMSGTLTLDDTGCAFAFSDWNMAMDMPSGGKVQGDTVTFTGAGWRSCSGTISGDAFTGSCGNGCAFEMGLE